MFCCSCPRFVSADDFVAVCFCSCNISNINHGLLDLNSDAICGMDVAAVACFVAAGAAVSPDAICGTAAAAVAAVGPDALCGTDEDEC